ncbi:unnamed protein product, partial [Candidula unifasciata]
SGVGYEGLGYFSIEKPYTSPQRRNDVCPESPDVIKRSYLSYQYDMSTPHKRVREPQILDARYPTDALNKWTNYKAGPTIILFHGIRGKNEDTPWLKEMADALLEQGDYNVIIVDWSGGSSFYFGYFLSAFSGDFSFPFTRAAANSRVVAAQLANIISHLINSTGLTPGDFHLIGHSIGAHLAGEIGRRIPGIGRISGLDPCGPRYTGTSPVVRLDPSDAVRVDVIHTNMAKSVFNGIGTTDSSGHADFYPNGGRNQPGCDLVSAILKGISNYPSCSHSRAHQYYISSIDPKNQFNSFPCNSESDFKGGRCQSCGDAGCSRMGFYADKYIDPNKQNVSYYLETAAEPPYALDNDATNNA